MIITPLRKIILLPFLVILWPISLHAATALPTNITIKADSIALQDNELHPLSPKDVLLYKHIFMLQADGKWKNADQLIKQLDNNILLGQILYQRYMHPTKYQSRYSELADWMLNYPDHPGAARIYDLARKKNGGSNKKLHKPIPVLSLNFPADKPILSPSPEISDKDDGNDDKESETDQNDSTEIIITAPKILLNKEDHSDINNLKTKIKRYLRRNDPDRAEKKLWAFERRNLLSTTEFNTLLGYIAGGYFFDNQDAKAIALGKISAETSRDFIYTPDWVSGLAAWRLGNCTEAAYYFEKVSRSSVAGDWMVSAGSYWAARAYLVCHQPEKVTKFLKRAATYHRTFYGLIAARQLGQSPSLNWTLPAFTKDHYDQIKNLKTVQRAIALAQTDKIMLADMELSSAWQRTPANQHEALLGLAARLELAGTQLKIGKIEEQKRMTALDSTLYPIPDTEPEGGFVVDRSLLFAIMRQESEFNSWAKSHAGARGLMQVMPRTASYISQDRSLRYSNKIKLDDPRYNMALGQKYIRDMLGKDFADGNLFKTLVAYNAGPGNLRKWERKTNFQDDPLLFIESIPARETRNYIERVISNYWIYQMRLEQPATSLDRVAMGDWPMYISQDNHKDRKQDHAAR
ncbi:MAG: lytic transglycosylase domain-containing protein [Emcibacter sp.]|nr:lytic transglycosylase domain-containing protein [Emcibacter sp.]